MRQMDEPFFRYQIEHVVARQHGGSDDAENLALACPYCNLRKGPNLSGIDPQTGELTPLFNPRRQRWAEHFRTVAGCVVGLTPIGRTTARLFGMNDAVRCELRLTVGRDYS